MSRECCRGLTIVFIEYYDKRWFLSLLLSILIVIQESPKVVRLVLEPHCRDFNMHESWYDG